MKSQLEIKLAPTPETDQCVKENKHIKFLEEDHWSLNGKFTYTHPIVCLSRKLERERDMLIKVIEPLRYWRDISECDCHNPLPNGGCLRCDLDKVFNSNQQPK